MKFKAVDEVASKKTGDVLKPDSPSSDNNTKQQTKEGCPC